MKVPKPSLFRPIPHAGDGCECELCNDAREENATVRKSMNWAHPPAPVTPRLHVVAPTPDQHRCPGLKPDYQRTAA